MGVKVGNTANLQWPSPLNHHQPHNQLPWNKSRCTLVFRPDHRSLFVGTTRSSSAGLFRSKSVGNTNMILNSPPPSSSIRRTFSSKMFGTSFFASKDDYEENDFIIKLQELKMATVHVNEESKNELPSSSSVDTKPPWWFGINKSSIYGNYQLLGDIGDHFVGRNASTVNLPMSLRMIKKKRTMEEMSHIPSISSSCCNYYYDSVQMAFSSMMFIIQELHSYILQLREVLLDDIDTNNLLSEVHKEMHASFCWLFQQIFSCTPTLMVSIMLLLANFTVNSMATVTDNYNHMFRYEMSSIAATIDHQEPQQQPKESETVFDAKIKTKADNAKKSLLKKQKAMMDRESLLRMTAQTSMQNCMNDLEDELLYFQTLPKYFQTDLIYQEAVRGNPENSMYLCNYAQFLYIVVHDHDRAEQYFKRAVEIIPVDAENLSRYADFLWMAKNNLCAAEEMYLTAIEIDPDNASHASNYANFLWNTGGEDTCFPLQA